MAHHRSNRELQGINTQPLLSHVNITGRLLSRTLIDRKHFNMNLGMYQHFDFFDSDTIKARNPQASPFWPCVVPYKLGTSASIGAGAMCRYAPQPGTSLEAYAHINGVLLAGILTDFYRDYHRNYNWVSGLSAKFGVSISMLKHKLKLRLDNQFYQLYTWKGFDSSNGWTTSTGGVPLNIQGDQSKAFLNHFEFTGSYRFWNRLSITAGIDWYYRHTNYYNTYVEIKNIPIWVATTTPLITSQQISAHLMLSYSF